jgi:putative transposase
MPVADAARGLQHCPWPGIVALGRRGLLRDPFEMALSVRSCRSYDELRNLLRLRTRHNQPVPANRLLHLRRATSALAILEAA